MNFRMRYAIFTVAAILCSCASDTSDSVPLIECTDGAVPYSCPVNSACCAGQCAAPGTICCNGVLTDPTKNGNCGGCGITCNAGEICQPGAINYACICPATGTKCLGTCCNDSCVLDLSTNQTNCGICGNACPNGQYCSNGVCSVTCQSNLEKCLIGGIDTCVDTNSSPLHCGACDHACPDVQVASLHIVSSICSNKVCSITCASGWIDADNNIVNGCELHHSVCGDGIIEDDEKCDLTDLNGWTCEDQVGEGSTGTPSCNSTCTGFENGTCTPRKVCGNNILDPGELCDMDNLGSKTCADLFGAGSTGVPQCNAHCNGFEFGTCTRCGDGIVNVSTEECDGNDIAAGHTCETEVGKGSTGTLTCYNTCRINTSGCSESIKCGNGTLDTSEQCDGTEFQYGMTECTRYDSKYIAGELKCSSCKIDTSDCEIKCGNGKIDADEECDLNNFGNKTCASEVGQGSTGNLSCTPSCKLDKSQCTTPQGCGDNNTLDISEECDNSAKDQFGNVAFIQGKNTCEKWNPIYSGGSLSCKNNCTVDESQCKLRCGNGTIEPGEECDSNNFGDLTCEDRIGFGSTGKLKCNSSCKIVDSECSEAKTCGDGTLQSFEACENNMFKDGVTQCARYDKKYISGTLKCTFECTIDESDCIKKCGNGVIDDGEICDTTQFAGESCASRIGTGSTGPLTCVACSYIDTSRCSQPSACGNGTLDSGEECELNGQYASGKSTCAKVSSEFSGGTLSCNNNCTINTSNCIKKCGNGLKDSGELCDGTAFGTASCAKKYGAGATGQLICSDDCSTIDYANCIYCGDGKKNGAEECDAEDWGTISSCHALDAKFAEGDGYLTCDPSTCKFNRNNCVEACVQGTKRCAEDTKSIEVCNANGIWEKETSCAGTTPLCTLVSSAPTCVCTSTSCGTSGQCTDNVCKSSCTEGAMQCSTNGTSEIVQKCSGGKWSTSKICSGPTAHCANNTCVACTNDTHCSSGKTCSSTNTCVSSCAEGSSRCLDGVIQRCRSGKWEEYENCRTSTPPLNYCYYVTDSVNGCAECLNDTHCASGQSCINYVCSDCTVEEAMQCDSTGKIIQECRSGKWINSLDCAAESPSAPFCKVTADSYDCVACLHDSDCPGTQKCEDNTCKSGSSSTFSKTYSINFAQETTGQNTYKTNASLESTPKGATINAYANFGHITSDLDYKDYMVMTGSSKNQSYIGVSGLNGLGSLAIDFICYAGTAGTAKVELLLDSNTTPIETKECTASGTTGTWTFTVDNDATKSFKFEPVKGNTDNSSNRVVIKTMTWTTN